MRCTVHPPGRIVPVDVHRHISAIRFVGRNRFYTGLSASYDQWLVSVRHDGVILLMFTGQYRIYVSDLHGKYTVDEALTK